MATRARVRGAWAVALAAVLCVPPSAGPQEVPELSREARGLLASRAETCYLLPDGRIVDASVYYELAEATRRCFRLLKAGKPVDAGGTQPKPIRKDSWLIEDSDDAVAWGFVRERGVSADWRIREAQQPQPGFHVYDMQDLEGTHRPPILVLEEGAPVGAIFVDDAQPDVLVRRMTSPHYAPVLEVVGERIVRVELRALGQTLRPALHGMYVRIPEGMPMPDDHLSGCFLLAPNAALEAPAPEESGRKRRSSYDIVHDYVPLTAHPTPEQLHDAIRSGRLKAVTWTWKRVDSAILWEQAELL